MAHPSTQPSSETFTFRLDSSLKTGLNRLAANEHIQPAELLRKLLRDHISQQERLAFEREARKQSLSIAKRALDPKSDEAQIMRELEAHLEDDDFAGEWKA